MTPLVWLPRNGAEYDFAVASAVRGDTIELGPRLWRTGDDAPDGVAVIEHRP